MKPAPLSPEEVQVCLETLPGWTLEGKELVKTFAFGQYLAGIEFVRRLAEAAEGMNHHPDLHIGWRRVTVRLSTHSAEAVTHLDRELALKAEALAGQGAA